MKNHSLEQLEKKVPYTTALDRLVYSLLSVGSFLWIVFTTPDIETKRLIVWGSWVAIGLYAYIQEYNKEEIRIALGKPPTEQSTFKFWKWNNTRILGIATIVGVSGIWVAIFLKALSRGY